MNRLSRIHDPPAYGDRVPSQNQLYDWSPANEADDEDELDQILQELRREQPNTHPEILRVLGRSQLDAERESRIRAYSSRLLGSNQPSQSADSSLRSAAILQSVRRHPRFASSRRGFEYAFPPERDSTQRPAPYSESRDRYNASETARQGARHRLSELHSPLDQGRERDRDMLGRVDSYRRGYLERNSSTPPTASPLLEQTIKYLSRIRSSTSVDDSLNCALDAGFLNKDYFCEENPDFVLGTYTLPRPAETSWLAPGAVLNGCQHATTVTSTVTSAGGGTTTTLYRFRNNDTLTSTLFDSSRPWLSQNYTSPHRQATSSAGPDIVTSHSPSQDRWPVKVTIHAVDYANMSLSATMEAYNVPSHPHSHQSLGNAHTPFTRTSSITTYLEGEILDFNTHTLLTESFKSTPSNDATYWRKLPPFQKFSDEELCRNLVSKRWFEECLSTEWVLMRWKERCFVKSLNRSTSDPVILPNVNMNTGFGERDRSVYSFDGSEMRDDVARESTRRAMETLEGERTERERERGGQRSHWQPWTGVNNSNPISNSNNTNSSPAVQSQSQRQSQTQANQEPEREGELFDDSGCGLTISGFYYVCLRRSDGRLEGLYYDPQSSPYQHLKLESVNGGAFAAWGF
ncbi:vacuolar import and degradation protein-domain-containing protein, partial [Clohesyomyces aquaticus]